ncbi:RNA polymerase sigma-70 factor [Massilibacteroides sp.]|uniref:RNA polymerase sigma-70 factor n=1 Tax=Massilibacteroides sp. TaxID=2034766 RepID=UPI002629E4D0|nr:RNA polymerase sigma-70 factor [Massilibacteroides sp.]MDD4514409.1 RNA polymerase sigma-70 factor [Massilibacteroides sp.]
MEFQQIYNEWHKKSYFFVRSYVQDDMVAEDIVSESLIKLWKTMSEKHIEHPQSLLFTLLRNRSVDFLRHESIRQAAWGELADAYQQELSLRISTLEAYDPENIFSKDIKSIIDKTLATLPEQTRNVFIMSRFEHLSVKEIATEYEITPKAVEYHITKALKALRISLKDYLYILFFL